jgi:alkylhydroperoxidase/carboxymuconolactone decarboxylase family protein YurZ
MVSNHDLLHHRRLRSLALNDEQFIDSVLAMRPEDVEASGLDPKAHALVRLGALLALDAAPASYQSVVGAALASGATVEEIVGVLIAVDRVRGPGARAGRRLRHRLGARTVRRGQPAVMHDGKIRRLVHPVRVMCSWCPAHLM